MNEQLKDQILHRLAVLEQEIAAIRNLLHNSQTEPSQTSSVTVNRSPELPEELISTLFTLVNQEEPDSWGDVLAPILHSSVVQHPIALDNFLRYSFKTFTGRWKEYLDHSNDPTSFIIERSQENNRGELSELRCYLKTHNRSAAPITLKKDPKNHLQWKIFSISL